MKVLFTILVTFFAGMGAGLGTGFAGMSAAAVISPMLITFLGMETIYGGGDCFVFGCACQPVQCPRIHMAKTKIWTSGMD